MMTRAAQSHQMGKMRAAGRLFETPGLGDKIVAGSYLLDSITMANFLYHQLYLADLTPFGLSSKTRQVDGSAGGSNLRNR